MVYFFTTLTLACWAITISQVFLEQVPSIGHAPQPSILSSSAYYQEKNQIVVYGGMKDSSSSILSDFYYYDLNLNTWGEILIKSSLKPPGLYDPITFVFKKKFYLLFGRSSDQIFPDFYSYDLETDEWDKQEMKLMKIEAVTEAAYCIFEIDGVPYLAFHGGITYNEVSSDLYLMNLDTFEVALQANNGNSPGGIYSHTISYYNESLYVFGIPTNIPSNKNFLYKYDLKAQSWSSISTSKYNPYGRNYHGSFVYNDLLYVIYGYNEEDKDLMSILKFSFISGNWESQSQSYESFRFGSSSVQIDSMAYFISGSSINTYINSIIRFDLRLEYLVEETVFASQSLPVNRKNHVSCVLENEIFIFAGVSNDNEILTDIWKFNLETLTWTEIKPEGDLPQGRESMSFTCFKGHGIMIYGGIAGNVIYDDCYFYYSIKNMWNNLSSKVKIENTRYKTCLVPLDSRYIIVGGQNNHKIFTDIIIYDSYTLTETILEKELPIEIIGFQCHYEISNGSADIYVVGGSTSQGLPLSSIIKIKVGGILNKNYTSSIEVLKFPNIFFPVNFALVADNNWLHIIGGTTFDFTVKKSVLSINPTTNSTIISYFPNELGIFSHSAVQYKQSIYVFGGVLSYRDVRIRSKSINTLYKLDFNSSILNLSCLNGVESSNCELCKQGSYSDNGTCTPCPVGTYSNSLGISSFDMCFPCGYGTYNDIPGSKACKECSIGSYCPLGCTKPRDMFMVAQNSVYQPSSWKNSNQDYSKYMTIIVSISFCFIFILVMLLLNSSKSRKLISKFDIFVDLHENDLNVPVIYRKTLVGGIFSMFFIIFAIIYIAFGIYSYFEENISQNSTLIPTIILEEDILAERFEISLRLQTFGSNCVESNQCMSKRNFTETGFEFDRVETICEIDVDDCLITRIYYRFHMISDGHIYLHFLDTFIYASYISLNLSISSSIPGENNKIIVSLGPEYKSQVFKGTSPTIFSFSMIPSIFHSDSSKWPSKETGYHIQNSKEHTKGSVLDSDMLFADILLKIEIELELNTSALITNRNIVLSWMMYLGAVLGSTLGMLELFGFFMSFTEKFHEFMDRRRDRKIFAKDLTRKRKITSMWYDLDLEDLKFNSVLDRKATKI